MAMSADALKRLGAWYRSMCNGDWEHTYGVEISNIDNPGWMMRVDLDDSYLLDRDFKQVEVQRGEPTDWIFCRKDGSRFVGHCGPENLDELITHFLDWAEPD